MMPVRGTLRPLPSVPHEGTPERASAGRAGRAPQCGAPHTRMNPPLLPPLTQTAGRASTTV